MEWWNLYKKVALKRRKQMIKRKLYTTPEVIVTKFEVNKNMMASITPETTASPDGPGDTETRDWFSPPEVTGGNIGDLFD